MLIFHLLRWTSKKFHSVWQRREQNSSFCFCLRKYFFGRVKMTFGLVDVCYSFPEGQAVKLTFLAP